MIEGERELLGTERFAIRRRIGAGGMGVVYEAWDRERGAPVALKTLRRLEPFALLRFKQEFRSLSDVVHPNLVALHELFSVEEEWFFSMELIHGVDFLSFLGRSGVEELAEPSSLFTITDGEPTLQPGIAPLSRAAVAQKHTVSASGRSRIHPERIECLRGLMRQTAEAVTALHDAGKLHCDIKPKNVLVTEAGQLVLLDFGLVRDLRDRRWDQGRELSVAGTAGFMAPEQAACLPLSPASDWYAVGTMLYQALANRLPFIGSPRDVLSEKQIREPVSPSRFRGGVPADLEELCLDLLRRNPEDRPPAREILGRLGMLPARADLGQTADVVPDREPFLGRVRHLDELRNAFAATRQGRAVIVHVHGRSGAGKSALVGRFLDELAEGEEAVVLAGRCYEAESVPFKALDSLVDSLAQYLRLLPSAAAVAVMPRDIQALATVFQVLRQVDAVAEAPPCGIEIPDRQELRRRVFEAFRELLRRLSARQPLVLAIDDLQWGDLDSAALLNELLRPPDPPALLLLATYRSEYMATSPCLRALLEARPGEPEVMRRELEVEPLSSDEARHLALELLASQGRAADSAQAEVIARESGGIPYFVHELVRSLREGAELRSSSPEAITLDQVLYRRVARLPEASRHLLEIVAVSGQPLAQGDAFGAAGLEAERRRALASLRTAHMVRSTGPTDQDQVEAYHDRVREVVVAHLPAEARRAHHGRLAHVLEASRRGDPETLAVHFHEAGEAETAGRYYAKAADASATALAFERAAYLYRRSLSLHPLAVADEALLRSRLGDALANAGRGEEAAREYLTAAAGVTPGEALELKRRAAHQFCISGHLKEGHEALRDLLFRVGLRLPATRASILFALLFHRAQLRLRGLRFRERPADLLAREEMVRADITWTASAGLSMFDVVAGADFQARNLLQSLKTGEPYRAARALAWEAAHTSNLGSEAWPRTAALLAAAGRLAERIGHPHALAMVMLSRGIAEFTMGHWQAAVRLLEEAESILRSRCTGVAWELDTAHTFTLWALVYRGELAEMSRRSERLLEEARERGDLFAATNLGTFMVPHVLLAADQPEEARRTIEEALARWPQGGFHLQQLTALMSHLYTDLYEGRGREAFHRIQTQWPWVEKTFCLRVQVLRIVMSHLRARSALAASLEAPDPQRLLRVARQAARRIERESIPWAAPMADLLWAGLAARRGTDDAALRHLERAAGAFDAAGMGSYAAAARRRTGELLQGDRGRELLEAADGWMAGQAIRDPVKMTRMHAPGFSA